MLGFLTDEDIIELANSGYIANLPPPLEDAFSRKSSIQPSSIDLTIGRIYLPGKKDKSSGSAEFPITGQHVLQPGETAVIETAEKFCLPSEVAGFGFPPSSVSSKGILMTNPGHIDPGYEGHMSFTVINMGRKAYGLEHGRPICTVLLFRLAKPPRKDFRQRGPHTPTNKEYWGDLLDRLSPDFLDVENRAKEIAKDTVKDANITIKSWQVMGTMMATIVVALVVALGSILGNIFILNSGLRSDVDSLEARLDVGAVQKEVDDLQEQHNLEDRLSGFEDRLKVIEEEGSE